MSRSIKSSERISSIGVVRLVPPVRRLARCALCHTVSPHSNELADIARVSVALAALDDDDRQQRLTELSERV